MPDASRWSRWLGRTAAEPKKAPSRRPDPAPAPAPGPVSPPPSAPALPLRGGATPAPPVTEALPDLDHLSDDPWERRAARLEFQVARLNRRILELETDLARRDERLREAVARLREAEETAELHAQIALLPPDAGAPAGTAGLATAEAMRRLEADRALAERRERDFRAQLARLRDSERRLEQALREKTAAYAEAREQLSRLQQENHALQVRVQALDEVASRRDREGRATLDRMVAERARIEELSSGEAQVRRKLEQAIADAEQQAALYRKNLLKAEETIRHREVELERSAGEREAAREQARALGQQLAETEARARALEARLAEQSEAAARRAGELQRRLAAAESEAQEAAEEAARLSAELADAVTEAQALRQSTAALDERLAAATRELDESRNAAAALEKRLQELDSRRAADSERAAREREALEAAAARSASELQSERAARLDAEARADALEARLRAIEADVAAAAQSPLVPAAAPVGGDLPLADPASSAVPAARAEGAAGGEATQTAADAAREPTPAWKQEAPADREEPFVPAPPRSRWRRLFGG